MSQTQEDLRETFVIGDRTWERLTTLAAETVLEPRKILVAGCSWTRPPYKMVRVQPGFGQLLVTRRGRGIAWADGAWQECDAGMAYLSPPRALHAFHAIDDDQPWEFTWVMFRAEADLTWPGGATLIHADPEPLWNAVYGLQRESATNREPAHLAAWAEIVALVVRRILRGQGGVDRLRSVWEAVERDLGRPWTLEDLADLACLSGGQLRAVCRKGTGRSPMEQVTYLRMQHAAALLLTSDLSVAQAAHAVGYANPFAFSTAFKRVMGVPPSRYRR